MEVIKMQLKFKIAGIFVLLLGFSSALSDDADTNQPVLSEPAKLETGQARGQGGKEWKINT